MDEREAVDKLIMPGTKRKGKAHGGIVQLWVTRACDRACFGCTQGSNVRGPSDFITLGQFEQAATSLKDYFGIVGVFGGNPCLHPKFPELCDILCRYIPFPRRGLWSNRLMGHGAACRRTFNPAFSNLNVHLDEKAYREIRRDWPEAKPFGLKQDSRHSPPFVAIRDLIEDKGRMWNLIADCDINRYWSAMIGIFRGELRAWFCEIAGAQSILHQHDPDYPDTGLKVTPDWWKRPATDFAEQVRKHCPECGIPLRGYGELACADDGTEETTGIHANVYVPKRRDRRVRVLTDLDELRSKGLKVTNYLGGAKR